MTEWPLRSVPDAVFNELSGLLWLAKDFESPLSALLKPDAWMATAAVGGAVPADRLTRIREGGIGGHRADWRAVTSVLEAEMRDAPGSTLLAIDGTADPADRYVEGIEIPHIVIADTIVYPVTNPDRKQIEAAWLQGSSAAGQVGLLTLESLTGPPKGEERAAAHIAAASFVVVLVAYDGEGALFLRRRT